MIGGRLTAADAPWAGPRPAQGIIAADQYQTARTRNQKMPNEEIPSEVLVQIRDFARAWAAEHGDPHPRDICAVTTNRQAAVKAIWGDEIDAPSDPIHLITLRGEFTLPGGTQPGGWAALFVSRDKLEYPPETASVTVRPAEAIPDLRLEILGRPYVLE